MALNFTISDWKAWFPTFDDTQPDVSVIPAMLRRRLSPAARMAMSVMMPLAETHGAMPLVYVSRHGDLHRTLQLLKDLANSELLSPTAFSLSVHNATAGLFSIQQGLTKNITAISCGDQELIPAMLEALGQCNAQEPKVMCVFCDEPPPNIYCEQVSQPEAPYAVALVISRGTDWQLASTGEFACDSAQEIPVPQPLEILSLLRGELPDKAFPHNKVLWQLRRNLL
ncbi:MAG: 3-oxoacyl-ACP synthase [Gammaproteobacteria bacterium]|nr:MAG: 3-oxoacyl-ACP synthase [Gammaproteobacteria bacterium]